MTLEPLERMNCYKPTKLCLLCSYRTIELKQFGKIKKGILNTRTYQQTDHGLSCSKCKSFVCIDCIKLVVPVMSRDKSNFLDLSYLQCIENMCTLKPSQITSPPDFIGHCCLVDHNIDASSSLSEAKNSHINQPSNSRSPEKLISGCIFFPEYDLFIDSPFDCMDIHAVGAEYNTTRSLVKKRKREKNSFPYKLNREEYLPARWHGVVSHEFAIEYSHLAPNPNGPPPNHWKCISLRNINIKMPHNNQKKKVCSS